MTRVFISYSHDSDQHRNFVLQLSDRLREDGIDCLIDQYINGFPPEGWQHWMENQIEGADFVLLVCTEMYLRRYRGLETDGGKGVAFEGVVISSTLYDEYYQNTKFIPVIPNNGSLDHVPLSLKAYPTYRLNSQYQSVYRVLTGQFEVVPPAMGVSRHLSAVQNQSIPRIYSDGLPRVEGELFGRKNELALLDNALASDEVNIVQFVASGGAGKTKLIRTWLDDNYDKIEALIAWSFYSQGSGEDKKISATSFFMQALKSLGSDKSVSDFDTEEEKGEYVANLLREKRCLLVLDGLEPLQQVGRGMRGELKDRAIRRMLRCLMGDHSSLCIITTRLPVHELQGHRQVVQYDLQSLSSEDGVALLRSFGVSGRDTDMLAAVREYGHHALALHLLGNALATYLDGDVRKRDTLTELIGDYDGVERHAFKMMQSYQYWLAGTTELKLLYLLGLFDRPVKREALQLLWDAQIPELTEGVRDKEWLVALSSLQTQFRLLSVDDEQRAVIDCHPLIREYFGKQLRKARGKVWHQANKILYEYYKSKAKEDDQQHLDINDVSNVAFNDLSPPVFPHLWASEWGQDQYGLWQAFTYKNIRHAFRWIPPGTFMMGSPDNEEGRTGLEDLHQVTLTKGFWLGETTVTQALWQAVMDKSPSHFKGDERPVEQVSWDDCQQFIEALRQVHPDLKPRLPWDAEWEYACRAGTSTPFSFGGKDDLTLERVNYSGKWDDYDSNGETKPVKNYQANHWGLYEMHGNVLEWCQDTWQANLGTAAVIDPEGQPASKEALRVLRGGSWGSRGRFCRSAFRGRSEPDYRNDDTGVRLSLGH